MVTPKLGYASERREKILEQIRSQTSSLLGFDDPSELDVNSSLLEMGADSIAMMEAVAGIKKTYGIQIAIRQFFEELTTLDALASYIDQNLSPEWDKLDSQDSQKLEPLYAPQQLTTYTNGSNGSNGATPQIEYRLPPQQFTPSTNAIIPAAPELEIYNEAAETSLEQIMRQQLLVMSQQLELLKPNELQIGQNNGTSVSTPTTGQILPTPQTSSQTTAKKSSPAASPENGKSSPKKQHISSPAELRKPRTGGLNEQQKLYVENLAQRYNKRTPTSKKLAQKYRPVLADSRASIGFRPSIKEMLYPIVAQRSQGSRVWDVDGNEYVDLTMGQGVLLFGHQPDFIMEAIQEQMSLGIQLHPRHHLAGEVAELICELTGVERVCFSNSGTESIMTSIRLARAATGRTKIVLFEGSYHGHGDTTLVRKEVEDGVARTVIIAPGIPANLADDIIVLDYDAPESLEFIQTHGHELAAVLVEPVQSNRLWLQPKEFLQKLRQVTKKVGAILIFDEITTGFRTHPGGAQALFGVEADIVNYGKVLGGGMPIGIIAGKSQYLDHIDGGMWNYGDKSFPQAERTFFGGTFCMHPLAMVATKAVLLRLKQEGPALQERLNQKTSQLAATLNNYFLENEIPIEVEHFSSIFRFSFTSNLDPFFYHLVEKGVYVWEWRKYFLSTAHTDEDIDYVIRAVKESIEEMRTGGFFLTYPPKSITTDESNTQKGFWTRRSSTSSASSKSEANALAKTKEVQFSLFYFGNYNSEFAADKYNLLLKGAKFADQNGFSAIWTPERHFHNFGGFSPNPSVLSAALARETQQIQLRAGSVVLPLHHPIRVAEEWSVVDNLSQGRVGIAFASGWHENDFVFAPDVFGNHRELMFQNIKKVQQLWRGESIKVKNGTGEETNVKIYPQPMQPELPIWITIVNNPNTYIRAGEIGAGVLTNLMGQKIEDLAKNIQLYRESLSQNGYDPASGRVTVLLHTLVGDDLTLVREQARQPMYNYMTSSIELFKSMMGNQGLSMNLEELTEDDRKVILETGYKRYVETSALIGTPDSCIPIIDNLIAIGVDEIACLIDFGVEDDVALENLPHLNAIKNYYQAQTSTIKVPLTEAQKQLWFLDKLESNSALAYIDSLYAQVQGVLNIEVMQQVVKTVVNRHEALRTRIDVEGQYQEILPNVTLDVPVIDFSNVPPSERELQIAQWIEQEFQKPFDLNQAPLFQVYILKLEEQLHRLVAKVHHIIADGWSVALILKEIGALYSSKCEGNVCSMQSPMQFREYVEWQNKQSQSEEMAVHESFWLEKFAKSIPVLNLPTDRPHPAVRSYKGSKQSLKIDAQLGNEIKRVSRQNGCTLFMTLLATYKVLLHRLSGDKDIVVGIPSAGRSLEGSENLVGYCVHLLPIISSLDENPTFSEYLRNIRGIMLDAYEHQDYPFASLLNKLNINRDFSRPVLISAAFNLDIPLDLPKMFGLEMSFLSPPKIPLAYDIYLTVTEVKGELSLDCGYNADVFDDDTIKRWLGHFQSLLAAIAVNPEENLAQLPLVTKAEQQLLLRKWNNTACNYPLDKSIHQLFEEQVERTPDSVAVVFENKHFTYRELNQRTNQLANYLQTLGVKPEALVGLYIERSLEMIVGLLGILKAGGAYLPIDPGLPAERLGYILENASAQVLVTQESLKQSLESYQVTLVTVDTDWALIEQQNQQNISSEVKESNLAYVIYTSGSTGKPKGVAIEHRSIVNYVLSIIDRLEIEAGSSFALVSTISADLGNTVLFPSLCTGGALHVLSWDRTVNSAAFSQYISEHSIDYLKIVPSHLAALQNPANPKSALPRKGLILGGEASQSNWISSLLATQPECKIYNHYGPTETTVGVLTYRVDSEKLETPTLPLGYPLNNTQVYILDAYLNPVPIGIPGEIYVGGIAVGRGYVNQPDLTAERFISSPFDGSRLYKTGDLARPKPDGNIEFLGRADNQVKIRGFRVELKDIESALCQHPDVESAAVIFSQQQLLAYVAPKQKRSPIISGLSRYKLPNNLHVAHLNKNETDYIYKEIFELQAYLRHGITVNPGDCIFDVGSNIGLFGLFMATICPQIKLYAFEPNPTVYQRLQANLSLYAPNSQSFNCGLSEQETTAEFTFFPGFSLLSGFYADAQVEQEVVKNFVSNQQNEDKSVVEDFLAQADEILSERFKAETFTAQLRTLSEIIKEQGIENIDLLKINVEKSELDVLKGIQEQDWGKIRQIVLEVDVQENLQPIVSLLEKHGYEYLVEQDIVLNNTELCYIYAIRPSERGNLVREQSPQAHIQQLPIFDDSLISSSELENFIKDKLPEYMLPNAFVLLSELPLTANGKIDRQGLPALDKNILSATKYVSPQNETQKIISSIWQEVLQIEKVGIYDNFFQLGGNSLLLIQVNRKLQEKLSIDLPVVELFNYPTIKDLSLHIAGKAENKDEELSKQTYRIESRSQGRNKMRQNRQLREQHRQNN